MACRAGAKAEDILGVSCATSPADLDSGRTAARWIALNSVVITCAPWREVVAARSIGPRSRRRSAPPPRANHGTCDSEIFDSRLAGAVRELRGRSAGRSGRAYGRYCKTPSNPLSREAPLCAQADEPR